MIRRPPRATRTDTLFPYTTLFRSKSPSATIRASKSSALIASPVSRRYLSSGQSVQIFTPCVTSDRILVSPVRNHSSSRSAVRSEERRVGTECVSVDLGGGRILKKKTNLQSNDTTMIANKLIPHTIWQIEQ